MARLTSANLAPITRLDCRDAGRGLHRARPSYTALPDEEQKLARIVAKLRATRLDREYLSLITDGDAALEAYVAKVLSAAD